MLADFWSPDKQSICSSYKFQCITTYHDVGVCSSIWSLDIFKEVAGKKHSEKCLLQIQYLIVLISVSLSERKK